MTDDKRALIERLDKWGAGEAENLAIDAQAGMGDYEMIKQQMVAGRIIPGTPAFYEGLNYLFNAGQLVGANRIIGGLVRILEDEISG